MNTEKGSVGKWSEVGRLREELLGEIKKLRASTKRLAEVKAKKEKPRKRISSSFLSKLEEDHAYAEVWESEDFGKVNKLKKTLDSLLQDSEVIDLQESFTSSEKLKERKLRAKIETLVVDATTSSHFFIDKPNLDVRAAWSSAFIASSFRPSQKTPPIPPPQLSSRALAGAGVPATNRGCRGC